MIRYSGVKRVHFVGIGGSGMSGIAEVLHNMGFIVSGSDIAEGETVKQLKRLGIKVYLGHTGENVGDAETLVYSSAVTRDNEEVKAAFNKKIPVIPRAEMLAELMRMKFAVAVAGTHGKTTTTSMLATILTAADKDPTFVVGGKLHTGESGARLGTSDYLVAEADESDGSFLRLFSTLAVITNIEDDHLDHYGSMDKLIQAFNDFGNKVPFYGSVIINYDCSISRQLISRLNKRVVTYGLDANAYVRAENIQNSPFQLKFDLLVSGKKVGNILLNVGGMHNVSNALAAIAAAIEIGIDYPVIKEGLERFYLPERRFQVLYFDKDYLVLDDYAHHPTEIDVTLDTLRTGDYKRIIAVFQPHRFTRLELLMDRFAGCFGKADKLILAPLYSANQEVIPGIDSKAMVQRIRDAGFGNVVHIDSFDGIEKHLETDIRKGDAVVFLSAGNLTSTAHGFAKRLEERRK